ncbi:Reticulocyte-binding protein 2 a [Merluccius polli]|uniref:Reticulocyte-binding protein 2 a n=1 Tax=Merluccius polli TaxID=89951 RepID=A0AA47MXX3_MERPO|nr:Reticulocyte-binding protein 2 a [Merluccius polli]
MPNPENQWSTRSKRGCSEKPHTLPVQCLFGTGFSRNRSSKQPHARRGTPMAPQRYTRQMERMVESHSKLLASLEMDFSQRMASELAAALDAQSTQNALCLKKQKEELCREAELEMMIDREKSQLLLQQYQRDITQFQSKLEDKEGEAQGLWQQLQQDRRSGEEQRRTREEAETRRGAEETRRREEETRRMKEEMKRMEEETSRREEEMRRELERLRREEALEISGAKAELQLLTNENAQLQQEVCVCAYVRACVCETEKDQPISQYELVQICPNQMGVSACLLRNVFIYTFVSQGQCTIHILHQR